MNVFESKIGAFARTDCILQPLTSTRYLPEYLQLLVEQYDPVPKGVRQQVAPVPDMHAMWPRKPIQNNASGLTVPIDGDECSLMNRVARTVLFRKAIAEFTCIACSAVLLRMTR